MFISFSLLLDQFSKFLNHSKAHTNFGHISCGQNMENFNNVITWSDILNTNTELLGA